ncbi:MAG: flagellar basal body-associated FliL family protein [Rubrivivax sp.]|nr:flagellar basal body-associated FliL family protein [Rubrivivax sp.]
MSNAAAAAAEAAPPAKSKKMLLIIVAAVVLVAVLGVGAMLMLKKKPAESEDEEADGSKPAKAAAVKVDPKAVPTFVPLDPFVVNLADKEAERYAQVGITLEITDAKLGDQIKALMPAIRHTVLMLLAEKTAAQLIDRGGKEMFARQVQRESSRVLGAEIEDDAQEEQEAEAPPPKKGEKGDKGDKGGKKKKKKAAPAELPVRAVHFSSFIVQ